MGDYWLAARLGAGGQGVVYEAYDASGARHALKTLHREADPFLRDRFRREAEAARRVAAFCTARIVAAGVDGDIPYLVTEYVPGPTLAQRVRSGGPLDEAALLRLATGAATALAAIHQADVVHRDLKPANVLLGPDGPRIIDFGIARAPEMSLTATADTAHLSPDGTHLATCTAGLLDVRPVRRGAEPVISDTLPRVADGPRPCPTVRFSPDGTRMAVASGPTGRHYDLRTGRTTGSFSGRSDFRFSSQGRFLVAWSEGAVEILASGEARLLARIPTADADASSVDVVLDEREKAVRHVAYGSDRFYEIDVTDVLDGRPEGTGAATEALSPDGDTAVVRTGHENPSLRVLDLASGRTVGDAVTQRTVPGPTYEYAAAVSDGGRVLAYADGTSGPDGTPRRGVTVRDLRAGREVLRVPVTNLEAVWRLAVSPDGRHLSVTLTDAGSAPSGADRYTTHVWDVQRRREIHRFDTPAGHGVFTPDGRRLLTTTGQELVLADGATRDALFGTAPNTEIAVSPDGRTVAVLKPSGLVELWDGAVRRRLGLMPSGLVRGGERHGDYVRGLRFSDDGGTLAALLAEETSRGGGDSVQLWDVAARVPLGRPLLLSGRAVDAVSFGGTVLRTVVGGTVQRLDLDGEALAERVCRRAGRDLTQDEWATYVPDLPRRDLCAGLPDSTPAPGTAQAAAPPGRHPAVPR
ncbi:protein kinase family protein [Streptomyces sp. enrichment culture]|uniref:protein kinase family protein n=1 Tax=Streptomyces sp. enrichment culture TaxID=1795815 RepID=UPI003F560E97